MKAELTDRNAGEGCNFIENNDYKYEKDGGEYGEILNAAWECADDIGVG